MDFSSITYEKYCEHIDFLNSIYEQYKKVLDDRKEYIQEETKQFTDRWGRYLSREYYTQKCNKIIKKVNTYNGIYFCINEEHNYIDSIRNKNNTFYNFAKYIDIINLQKYNLFDHYIELYSFKELFKCYFCNTVYDNIKKRNNYCKKCKIHISFEDTFFKMLIQKTKCIKNKTDVEKKFTTFDMKEDHRRVLYRSTIKYQLLREYISNYINNYTFFYINLIDEMMANIPFLEVVVKDIDKYKSRLFYESALERYINFINLDNPDLLPTIGISLVWRTHILSGTYTKFIRPYNFVSDNYITTSVEYYDKYKTIYCNRKPDEKLLKRKIKNHCSR